MSIMSFALRVCVAAAATCNLSFAAPLAGQFNFGGTAVVSLMGVDYIPPVGGGTGDIVVLPGGNTGDFAVLNSGFSFGTIADRDEATQPVGQPLSVANWLTLNALPNLSFTLEFIRPGSFSAADCFSVPANEQTCTLPPFDPDGAGPDPAIRSPYNLTNFTDAGGRLSSTASFSVRGTVLDTITSEVVPFDGIFNATFQNIPYQQLVTTVLSGGSVTTPFTAQVTVVPEPSSAALALAGIACIALRVSRRRRGSRT